jgi:hypothetical protein
MECTYPKIHPLFSLSKAHLYVRFADVVRGLHPPCCTACPRLPQVATAKLQIGNPSTLSVEVAHNAMRNHTGAHNNQTNSGAPPWPSTI